MSMKKNNRQLWADLIRVLAICMVIIIHVTAPVILNFSDYSAVEWNFANLLNSVSRMSIALFLMISGAFILQKKEPLTTFIKKRVSRIVIPWFMWGSIQLLYNYDFSISKIISDNIASKLLATYFGGFWFMPMILGVYMLTPIIKPFVQQATKREWLYVFCLWFIFVPIFTSINLELEKNISVQLPVWIEYIGYYLFGYYAVHKLKLSKKIQKELGLVAGMSVVLIALNAWYQSNTRGAFFSPAYEYTNILVTISSITSFIWLKFYLSQKHIQKKLSKSSKKITLLSLHSFGVFLSHSLLLEIISVGAFGIKFSALSTTPFISIPVLFALVASASFGLTILLNRYLPNVFT